jgi:AhpD family alkylhydroperoxidase
VHIGGKRKPTLSAGEFVATLKSLLAEFPTLVSIWRTPELDPAFRELLMVAVAQQNDAPYCDWAHRTWAETVGASQAELARIDQLNLRGFSRSKRAALDFVRALAASDFKDVPGKLRREMEAHYSAREIQAIELVARVMDLTNRSANTYEGMLARLQGKPSDKGSLVDEAIFSGVFLALAPPLVLLLSRNAGRPFLDTTRSLIAHVQRHYAGART